MRHIKETSLRTVGILREITVRRRQVTAKILCTCHITGIVIDMDIKLHLINMRASRSSYIMHLLLGSQKITDCLIIILCDRKITRRNLSIQAEIIQ